MEKLTIVALSVVIFADDQVSAPDGEPMDVMNCMSKDHVTTIRRTAVHNLFLPHVERFIPLIYKSDYTKKGIVLRELISNAADALEKVRLLALQDKKVFDTNPELSIGIVADKRHRLLIIGDSGIGMTKQDLLIHFSTIKKFGSAMFFGEVPVNPNSDDTNRMIEQIGVGLFSAFLIADLIVVYTKHDDDVQYVWACNIDGYSISKDSRGPTLKRGTRIELVLKEEAADFLEPDTLNNLIINNVEPVDFPIYMCNRKTIQIEHDDDSEAAETEKKKDNEIRDDEIDAKITESHNDDGEAAETEKKEDNEIRDDEVDAKITQSADDSKKRIVEKIVCDWERLNITTPHTYRAKFVRRTLPNVKEVVTNVLRTAYNTCSPTIAP